MALERRRRERDLAALRRQAVEFDIVLDVKAGGECLRLGYIAGQDPFAVARDFVWTHNLWHGYAEQLALAIRAEVAARDHAHGTPLQPLGSYYSSAAATQAAETSSAAAPPPLAAPLLADSRPASSRAPTDAPAPDASETDVTSLVDTGKRRAALEMQVSGARAIQPPDPAASFVYVRQDSELGLAFQEMSDDEWDRALSGLSGLHLSCRPNVYHPHCRRDSAIHVDAHRR